MLRREYLSVIDQDFTSLTQVLHQLSTRGRAVVTSDGIRYADWLAAMCTEFLKLGQLVAWAGQKTFKVTTGPALNRVENLLAVHSLQRGITIGEGQKRRCADPSEMGRDPSTFSTLEEVKP